MSVTPKSMWSAVKAMLHSVYDQPDAGAVHAQFDRLLDYVDSKLPDAFEHLTPHVLTSSRSQASPTGSGNRYGPTTRESASTERSAAAPTASASSPTVTRSSASSAQSLPNKPTNGQKDAATSASTSSPSPASPSSPTPEPR
jgi:hypothetical protein